MEDGTETLYVRAGTGGTSTQLVVMDESGRVFTNKAPTTPDALERRVRLEVPDFEELFFGVQDADFRRLVAEDEVKHFDVDVMARRHPSFVYLNLGGEPCLTSRSI